MPEAISQAVILSDRAVHQLPPERDGAIPDYVTDGSIPDKKREIVGLLFRPVVIDKDNLPFTESLPLYQVPEYQVSLVLLLDGDRRGFISGHDHLEDTPVKVLPLVTDRIGRAGST